MDHYKAQSDAGFVVDGPDAIDEARKMHHLATADPEPERGDGTLTGAAHEFKYGLERAEHTVAEWVARGVHPTENRALAADEKVDLPGSLETTSAAKPPENADAPAVAPDA